MKLAVFGGSGRTGLPLVRQALAKGYMVNALVRTPSKLTIQDDRLNIIQGDAGDPADVEKTVAGTDAVLSALGHTKTSAKNIQTVATQHIVSAMKKHGVERIVSLTGAGVKDPNDEPKFVDRVFGFLLVTFARDVIEDAEAHAEVLRESGLRWTLVRGPRLTGGEHTGTYKVGYVGKDSGTQVSRADTADFMLKALETDEWVKKAPMVSY